MEAEVIDPGDVTTEKWSRDEVAAFVANAKGASPKPPPSAGGPRSARGWEAPTALLGPKVKPSDFMPRPTQAPQPSRMSHDQMLIILSIVLFVVGAIGLFLLIVL